jgi:hypothetical protein
MSVAISKDDDGFITPGKEVNCIDFTISNADFAAPTTSTQPPAEAGPSAPVAKSSELDSIRFLIIFNIQHQMQTAISSPPLLK